MVRWQPEAGARLQAAAYELFDSKGFDETTVVEIALAAGLTERTFYRYFADKREVIFGRQDLFKDAFLNGITEAKVDASPLRIVTDAVIAAATFFADEHRAYSQLRHKVIAANPELQERELLKMSALAGAIAEALRARGIHEPAATLAAETGVTVFRVSFAQWIAPTCERSLIEIEREVFDQFGSLAALR
jgi:AcrR family transcriptional regulator